MATASAGFGDQRELWHDDDHGEIWRADSAGDADGAIAGAGVDYDRPTTYTIASGTVVQFHATGNYSDNSTMDVTKCNLVQLGQHDSDGEQNEWQPRAGHGVTPGRVTITATLNGLSGTASLTI